GWARSVATAGKGGCWASGSSPLTKYICTSTARLLSLVNWMKVSWVTAPPAAHLTSTSEKVRTEPFSEPVARLAQVTSTMKVQVAVLPEASVAVQVTVVLPMGNTEPEAGTHAAVTPGQLSVAVGGG